MLIECISIKDYQFKRAYFKHEANNNADSYLRVVKLNANIRHKARISLHAMAQQCT